MLGEYLAGYIPVYHRIKDGQITIRDGYAEKAHKETYLADPLPEKSIS